MTTQAVLLILNSTRAADIPNAIKGLDHEQQAYLMAYLYKVGDSGEKEDWEMCARAVGNGVGRGIS